MKFNSTALLIFAVLQSSGAYALSQSGTLKELGETHLSDEITDSTKASAGSAIQPSDAGPATTSPSLSAYGKIDAFSEFAILQRKFLPRSRRIELGVAYGLIADNAFFEVQTVYGHVGYSFTETLGIEASGFSASTKTNRNSESLLNNGGVATTITAIPTQFLGLDFRWSPIYGKISLWNRNIVPVEQFFLIGAGQTELSGTKAASTLHLGTGYSFGLRKWLALRLELDLFSYKTAAGDSFNDTHLNIGLSTFLPGAKYR